MVEQVLRRPVLDLSCRPQAVGRAPQQRPPRCPKGRKALEVGGPLNSEWPVLMAAQDGRVGEERLEHGAYLRLEAPP